MAAFDPQEDYYAILGLSPDANPEDIDIAKRTLLPKWHPDNNSDPTAAEMSQKITEAHSVLSDFRERFAYDNDRFKERSPVHRFLYRRFISDGLRENPSQLSNFLYTKVGVPISKRALNRANAGRYNPNIESRLVTQARQDYLTAARKAFRGLGLMPFGRDYNYDAEICEYFDKTLMGYKNSPPEPQEKPKRLNPTINSSIEKDIKFFNGLQGKKREFTAFCTSQSFDLTSRECRHEIFAHIMMHRMWTAARKDFVFLRYRVAIPRHCFK